MRDEAHLRGLERIIYSTTISPRLWNAKPACAGYAGLFLQRPYAPGYARRSPPARACQQAASAAFALLAEPFRTTARRRGEPLGYPGRSPPARAMPDYFFKDHIPLLPACRTGVRRFQRTRASLKGWVFPGSPAFLFSFLASGRPDSPSSPCGRRGLGGMRGKSARECRKPRISPRNSTPERQGV